MIVLIICKNKDGPFNNETAKVVTAFSHHKSIGIIPDVQGQHTLGRIWKRSKLNTFNGCLPNLQE